MIKMHVDMESVEIIQLFFHLTDSLTLMILHNNSFLPAAKNFTSKLNITAD